MTNSLYSGWDPDEPIVSKDADVIGRISFANAVAEAIAHAPGHAGFALGLVGPWGSGKSSLINLITQSLHEIDREIRVLSFNPWYFVGSTDLIGQFFTEIGGQLVEHDQLLPGLADKLGAYASVASRLSWIPSVGAAIDASGKLAGAASGMLQPNKGKESLQARREELEKEFIALGKRIIVIIDDIDRLESAEIREIMRLVRLTGHFSNLVYLLAFDRQRVERALAETFGTSSSEDGRLYLEKILQAIYHVPELPQDLLEDLLRTGIFALIKEQRLAIQQQVHQENVRRLVLTPMLQTVRDVRRFLNILPVALSMVDGEVCIADTLALEALRLFAPDAWLRLPEAVNSLERLNAAGIGSLIQERQQEAQARFTAVLDGADKSKAAVIRLCRLLFPASERFVNGANVGAPLGFEARWRRERRVAHPEVYRIYRERTLPSHEVSTARIQILFNAMGEGQTLRNEFSQFADDTLARVLDRLLSYVDEYPTSNIGPSIAAILDQLPRLPIPESGIERTFAELPIRVVVLRWLERISDERLRLSAVKDAYSSCTTLSGRAELVNLVGFREGTGHRLVAESEALLLEQRVLREYSSRPVSQLGADVKLDRVSRLMNQIDRPRATRKLRELVRNDEALLKLLVGSISRSITSGMSDAVGVVETDLHWWWFPPLFGEKRGTRRAAQRVEELAVKTREMDLTSEQKVALELALQYARGQRSTASFERR